MAQHSVSNSNDPLILSIETAIRGGSVALLAGEVVLGECVGDPSSSQSNLVLSYVLEVLDASRFKLSDVELIAISLGPGSFTGLRSGVATAKAFASCLGMKLVGVPTLFAIAHCTAPSEATLVLIPAGRCEVFSQLLKVSTDGFIQEAGKPSHQPLGKVLERFRDFPSLNLCGVSIPTYMDEIRDFGLQNDILITDGRSSDRHLESGSHIWRVFEQPKNLAINVGRVAQMNSLDQSVSTESWIFPIYVRPSDAELKLRCQH